MHVVVHFYFKVTYVYLWYFMGIPQFANLIKIFLPISLFLFICIVLLKQNTAVTSGKVRANLF